MHYQVNSSTSPDLFLLVEERCNSWRKARFIARNLIASMHIPIRIEIVKVTKKLRKILLPLEFRNDIPKKLVKI